MIYKLIHFQNEDKSLFLSNDTLFQVVNGVTELTWMYLVSVVSPYLQFQVFFLSKGFRSK